MPPAARVTDMHTCPMQTPGTPPIPHVGGPIIPPCMPNVLTGGLPQARVGDMAICVGPPDSIVKGSAGVMVGGMPAARIGDLTAHGGSIVAGLPTVIIGEVGGGGASGGGGGGAGMGAAGGAPGSGGAPMPIEGPAGNQPAAAQALTQAAQQGTPFCEQCMR